MHDPAFGEDIPVKPYDPAPAAPAAAGTPWRSSGRCSCWPASSSASCSADRS
ncbi:hypothetical protein [Blastococcus brunescens]|uniref:Uncharacterized protein n=1 Tax=Blastococcus brunescens TaxID=1564165 RepID=A0ABZ1BAR7_9ACTN|nr:hypothetical protein [Blastococcus sp. BMG 8361]WRL67371.1 hypothetical protein U6N30_12380 [Blastococcus sp. BMG 8361]